MTEVALPELGTAWARPRDVEEACRLLASATPLARPVAGATILTPAALAADRSVRLAVDVLSLGALAGIRRSGEALHVGAAVSAAELAGDDHAQQAAPLLVSAAAQLGDEVIRRHATVGGNLAALAATDLSVALAALGASAVAASVRGSRSAPVEDLELGSDELITEVVVPDAEGLRWAYGKLTLNASAYSVATVAVAFRRDGTAAAFAGVGPRPARLLAAEEALAHGEYDAAAVAGEACAGLDAATDALADAAYRRRAAASLLEDALVQVRA